MINNDIVNKAINYIMLHILESITLEEVADYCNISKFYFSRIFKAETGESVYGFIKRVKLDQSALRLRLESQKTITDIGLDYGYSASNYSTAFKNHMHLSPYEFRKQTDSISTNTQISFEEIDKQIKIEIHPDYKVIYERKISDYKDMKND